MHTQTLLSDLTIVLSPSPEAEFVFHTSMTDSPSIEKDALQCMGKVGFDLSFYVAHNKRQNWRIQYPNSIQKTCENE